MATNFGNILSLLNEYNTRTEKNNHSRTILFRILHGRWGKPREKVRPYYAPGNFGRKCIS
jgi:hypothetical protein